MSDRCSGPVSIIQNIQNEKFPVGSKQLTCNAGFALSEVHKMNAEPITMKRPPSDDDELTEVVETKKVKLIEDNETLEDIDVSDEPSAIALNGISKDEDVENLGDANTNGLEVPVESNSDKDVEIVNDSHTNGLEVPGESNSDKDVQIVKNAHTNRLEVPTKTNSDEDVEIVKDVPTNRLEVPTKTNSDEDVEIVDDSNTNGLKVPTKTNSDEDVEIVKDAHINRLEVPTKTNSDEDVEIVKDVHTNRLEVPTKTNFDEDVEIVDDSNTNGLKVPTKTNSDEDVEIVKDAHTNRLEVPTKTNSDEDVEIVKDAHTYRLEVPTKTNSDEDVEIVDDGNKNRLKVQTETNSEPSENSSECNGTSCEGVATDIVDQVNSKLTSDSNNEIGSDKIIVDHAADETHSEINDEHSTKDNANDEENIDEAPTLEDIEIPDETSNTSKEIDPCDISNSNLSSISSFEENGSVDMTDDGENFPKTELANIKTGSIVKTDSVNHPTNGVNTNNSDLIDIKDKVELSYSGASPPKNVNEELAFKSPNTLTSQVQDPNLDKFEDSEHKTDDSDSWNNSINKILEESDSEIKCDESESLIVKNSKNENLELDDKKNIINVNDDDQIDNKENTSYLIAESEITKETAISEVALEVSNSIPSSNSGILEDNESIKVENNDKIKETHIENSVPVTDSKEKNEKHVPVAYENLESVKNDDFKMEYSEQSCGKTHALVKQHSDNVETNSHIIENPAESVTDAVEVEDSKEPCEDLKIPVEPSDAMETDSANTEETAVPKTDIDHKAGNSSKLADEKSDTIVETHDGVPLEDNVEIEKEESDEPAAKKIKLDDTNDEDVLNENKSKPSEIEIKEPNSQESKENVVQTEDSNEKTTIDSTSESNVQSLVSTEESQDSEIDIEAGCKLVKTIITEVTKNESFNKIEPMKNDEKAQLNCKEDKGKDDFQENTDKVFFEQPKEMKYGEQEEKSSEQNVEETNDNTSVNESNEKNVVAPKKLSVIDIESVDSDIEILDDSAKQNDTIVNESQGKDTNDTALNGEESNAKKIDQKETDAMEVDKDRATPMDTDEVPSPTIETASILDDSSNDSVGLTININEENKENEEKNKEGNVPTASKDGDDEIVFIKECKKVEDCPCVMCYKNKVITPEKGANDKSAKDTTKGKRALVDEGQKEKRKKIKIPKLIEKFESLSREGLEKFVSTMFLKVFSYESELGQLRETVNKMRSENTAMKTLCTAQGKQLKELGHVHEKAMGEIKAFTADPKREGNIHPVKITRSVGLQVNVTPLDKKRLSPQSSAAKAKLPSTVVTRSANGINKLKRPAQRSVPYSPRSRTPNASPSPSPSPVASPSPTAPQRPRTTPMVRPGRPIMGVRPGIRILPPRTLNNSIGGVRSPGIAPLRSPVSQVSPRQSPVVGRIVTRAPNVSVANTITSTSKTSGGSTVEFIDLDDDVQTTASPKANMKVVRSTSGPIVRTSTATTIRVATPTSTSSTNRNSLPSQRLYVPLSQGYKIRAATGTNNTILTSLPSSSSSNPTTTYVLNTAAGLIPFQTNNVRLNIRPGANSSPVRINYQGHPAPVPPNPRPTNLPPEANFKTVPAAPKLRVQLAQEGRGIQLTWSLDVTSEMATIESYQLYAYQENKSVPINSSLWKPIGRLDALPLPMACTLTQFTSGHTYHFLVRAADVFKRFSSFSNPGTIHLRS